ncbi:MAG: DM13 domain-containing protein [Hyphomicrobiaceae bacterium]|nr:MAG: DM13 domain-containing protein [Hyphomicrobiaceae bacterium]
MHRKSMTKRLICAALLLSAPLSQADAAEVLRRGTFKGVGGHKSSGSVEIVKDGDVLKVVFKADFVLKDAPDPKLAWGKNGYRKDTIFGKLEKLKGEQEYVIPAGTDVSAFNEFWLWCQRFNVGLAVAKLD